MENDEVILGMMSMVAQSGKATNAMEIVLSEVSAEDLGKVKKLDRIAGCLIAYACREAFKPGTMDGCLSIIKAQ